MTVKLVLLKSGETLISDVKEGFCEDKMVCYILENPFVPILNEYQDNEDTVVDGQKENKYNVELFPWPYLSKDDKIEIPPDCVLTLTNPIETIEKIYNKRVLKNGNETNENNSNDEQSDSDQSD